MLFADGIAPDVNLWSENVSVGTGAYRFTGWVANADPAQTSQNPATLALFVNGNEVGNTFTITQAGGIWQQWTSQLNFNTASQLTLSIQDINSNPFAAGNDFTIYYLSVAPAP